MNSIKFPARAGRVAALASIFCLTNLNAYAGTPEPPGLFAEQAITQKLVLPAQAIAGKARRVKLDLEMLHKERFFVDLPGGVSFEAVQESQQDRGRGRSSWTGHAEGDPDSTVVLGISGNAVYGTFRYKGKLFKLEPRANGDQVVSEVQTTDPAPELDPIPVADKPTKTAAATTAVSVATEANGAEIDVLVVYTPAVQAIYGAQGAEALVEQAVAEANQAYANSGMTTRLNLVLSYATDYIESGDMGTDLSRLKSNGDGFMDELQQLRDMYGADVVSLIENDPASCGIAYRMASLSTSFSFSAFSVVHHSCATGYYSFAHEIGHNQGAHHDAANATGTAIYPYAYGYQAPNSAFRTVMAYACPGGCTRVGFFSNPDKTYNGVPTGVVGAADNALTIDKTAPTVAAFREHVTQPPGC
jgi:peptidyl-Asp metalloendopeptidase